MSDLIRVIDAKPTKHSIRRYRQRIDDIEPQEAKDRIMFMWKNATYLPDVSQASRRMVAKFYYDIRKFYIVMIASAKCKRIITLYKPTGKQITKWNLKRKRSYEN
jgi:hypothetical protein